MRYSLACISDVGVMREHNEDNIAFFGNILPVEHQTSPAFEAEASAECPFIVGIFDGMGGEADGENASYIAARVLEDNPGQKRWNCDSVLELFARMEDAVCRERDRRRAQAMGTTATVVAVDGTHAYVANVGDSPAMLYADGELRTLSHAHTDAETLRILGITGRKPGLTQFLGMSDGEICPSPHVMDFDIQPGSTILLASDGLTEPLDDDTIRDVLASGGETCDKAMLLRDLAIQNGGLDNITVLLCEAVGPNHIKRDVMR